MKRRGREKNTKNASIYFAIKVQHALDKESLKDLMQRVSEHNDDEANLAFDCVDADGKLVFIYALENYDDEKEALESLTNLRGVFGENFDAQMIEPDTVQKDKVNSLNADTEFRRYRSDWTCIERWNLRTEEQILADLTDLEYDELKLYVKKLSCYLHHVKSKKLYGNYNIVIVGQDEDIDKTGVLNTLYDFYCVHNIITHYAIYESSVDSVVRRGGNASFMINIVDDWNNDQRSIFRRNLQPDELLKICSHKTVYITFMNEDTYKRVQEQDAFNIAFPHVIHMPALSIYSKYRLLERAAQEYGFALAEDFIDSDVLNFNMKDLKQAIVRTTTVALYKQDYSNIISGNDIREALGKENKETKHWQELEELIGLDNVKSCIKEIATFLERRGRKAVPSLHMVFRGNPGTGKTTVARLLGEILQEIGILKQDAPFVEVERKDLIALYVGHTAIKTAQKIKQAMGGILFIDEAYALNQTDNFSHEAIATLVKQMEDHRDDFICIMAGYTDEMNKFLDVNPGMRERVQFYLDFPDYNATEMLDIFQLYCRHSNYELLTSAQKQVEAYFQQLVTHKDGNFANARLVRKIFDRVRLKQAQRTEGNEINAQDIVATFTERDMETHLCDSRRQLIGFVA